MHETLVILKKDVRRLWWQIGAALAMCAIIGRLDAGRAAAQPGVVEGLLNIVLPLVWAFLIAQAIHHETLVGDREFWMTRPYRWGRLLAAKALFAALAVHVPSFLTDAAILAARGYDPLASLPQLLVKQLLLAEGLTLPAMALAAVVSNLTQFVIGIPILLVTLTASLGFSRDLPFGHLSYAVARLAVEFLAVAAISLALLQYRRRRTRLTRTLAVSALLAAGLLATLATGQQTFALNMAESPAANIHATMTLAPPDPRAVHGTSGRRVFTTLPFSISGLPESDWAWMASVSMDITGANGVRYHYDPLRMDFDMGLTGIVHDSTSLFLGLKHAAYDRIEDSKVTISGTVGFLVYERGQEVRLPVNATREVTQRMHCSSMYGEEPYDSAWLDVFCDSPDRDEVSADIWVPKPPAGWFRPDIGGFRSNRSPSPLIAWLSPLHRQQQSFRVGVPDRTMREAMAHTPIAIVPQRLAGYSTVSFKASDIDLREYTR